MSEIIDNIKVKVQYILPKKLLSRAIGKVASSAMGKATEFIIEKFIKFYNVDMSEAEIEDISQYKTFNDFFTRALKKNARPIAKGSDAVTSTSDGTISEFGEIYKDAMIQAKGHYYSLENLLGGDNNDAKSYENGSFVTTYLSPSNYHRVHMPLKGKLKKMIFVPGELFSVNPLTANNIDDLYAKNERAICFFENAEVGEFVVVLVGATIVASIKTVFSGIVAPSHGKEKTIYHYNKDNITLDKGSELGQFLLGSTTILIFKKDTIKFVDTIKQGLPIKVGEKIAMVTKK